MIGMPKGKEKNYIAWRERLLRGIWPFSIPLGYKIIGYTAEQRLNKDGGRIRKRNLIVRDIGIDPDIAPIVKKLFDLYVDGRGYVSLSNMLKEQHQINLSQSHMARLLSNKFYIGYMEFDDILYPHEYGHIIDKELFQKVIDIRRKYTLPSKKSKKTVSNALFKGLIKCEVDGRTVTPQKQKGIYYYHCNAGKKHGGKWMREDVLLPQFINKMDSIVVNRSFFDSLDDNAQELLRRFSTRVKSWFTKSRGIQQSHIAQFLFKNIILSGDTILCDLVAPLNGQNQQEFSFAELEKIVARHSKWDLNIYTKQEEKETTGVLVQGESLDKKIIRLCSHGISVDQLSEKLSVGVTELNDILFDLMIQGRIVQDNFGYWKIR